MTFRRLVCQRPEPRADRGTRYRAHHDLRAKVQYGCTISPERSRYLQEGCAARGVSGYSQPRTQVDITIILT